MRKNFTCFLTISLLFTTAAIAATDPSANLLLSASKEGRQAIVESLIQSQIDVNVKTTLGETPLIAAALAGHTEIVRLLAEKGADVNAQLKSGDSPLHIAIRHGNLPLVKFLIGRGATIIRPFTYAMTFQQFEVASYIYGSYLETAIQNGDTTQLKELLEPFSQYKSLVHLPLQDYVDQLSQNKPSDNTNEMIAVLKEFIN
jgi:ankyrin repeat protein